MILEHDGVVAAREREHLDCGSFAPPPGEQHLAGGLVGDPNVAVHDGVTYIFANKENLDTFNADPEKYVPAYGGYCAYGVSVGKKFVGDPEVWRVVEGRLYLNLDTTVQDIWFKDVDGNIVAANDQWNKIRDKSPAEL